MTKATRKNVALVAKFLDGKKVENITFNCFKLHRSYSISFNLSSVGRNFLGFYPKGPDQWLVKEKENFSVVFTYAKKIIKVKL